MGIASEALKNFKGFSLKNMPEVEPLSPGHRACQGCGEVLALRQAMKAIGTNVVVCSATGCMEIITSPLSADRMAGALDSRGVRKCGRRCERCRSGL